MFLVDTGAAHSVTITWGGGSYGLIVSPDSVSICTSNIQLTRPRQYVEWRELSEHGSPQWLALNLIS